MKQLISLIAFVIIASTAHAQKVFINQTKEQIRDYWETQVSSEFFHEGTWEGTDDQYFSIMVGNAGTPIFEATFDENGKCKSHSMEIDGTEISVMQARLKKSGYVYNNNKKAWIDTKKTHAWKIEQYVNLFSFECTRL